MAPRGCAPASPPVPSTTVRPPSASNPRCTRPGSPPNCTPRSSSSFSPSGCRCTGVAASVGSDRATGRIQERIAQLDATIRRIRTTVLACTIPSARPGRRAGPAVRRHRSGGTGTRVRARRPHVRTIEDRSTPRSPTIASPTCAKRSATSSATPGPDPSTSRWPPRPIGSICSSRTTLSGSRPPRSCRGRRRRQARTTLGPTRMGRESLLTGREPADDGRTITEVGRMVGAVARRELAGLFEAWLRSLRCGDLSG